MAILPECRLEVEKKRLLGVFLTETEEIEAQLFYDSSTLINLSIRLFKAAFGLRFEMCKTLSEAR